MGANVDLLQMLNGMLGKQYQQYSVNSNDKSSSNDSFKSLFETKTAEKDSSKTSASDNKTDKKTESTNKKTDKKDDKSKKEETEIQEENVSAEQNQRPSDEKAAVVVVDGKTNAVAALANALTDGENALQTTQAVVDVTAETDTSTVNANMAEAVTQTTEGTNKNDNKTTDSLVNTKGSEVQAEAQKGNETHNTERVTKTTDDKPTTDTKTDTKNNAPEKTQNVEVKKETKTDVDVTDVTPEPKEVKETINIKVGDIVNLKAPQAEFVDTLADKILINTSEGVNDFVIQITPKELGTIDVHVSFKDGQTVVNLSCTDQKTYNILTENAKNLSTLLQNNTGAPVVVNVKEDAEASNKNFNENFDGHNNQNQQNGEQQQQRHDNHKDTADFIQQLRLGLVETDVWEKTYNYF